MITLTQSRRRIARDIARAGSVVSAALFVVSLAQSTWPNAAVSAVAQNAGTAQILAPSEATIGAPLASGGSATVFALTPPAGAECTGDSTSGGYRVQSYIVPVAVDPATLTFNAQGPMPAGTGANLRQPLFSGAGTPIVNKTTAVAASPGGGGLVTGMPTISFGAFGASGPQIVPAGTYNVGFACTLGSASATQLDKYWNAVLTFAVDPADMPSGITWQVVSGSTPTTTTAPAATTTTAPSGATTTTVKPGTTTTTTVATGATTTTLKSSSTVTTASESSASSGHSTPATGAAPIPTAIWALLFLVFGRMAILLGRPVRVIR
ncbi:MAG: hypothetical protein WCK14_07605 [Actinomycetota bacterium]